MRSRTGCLTCRNRKLKCDEQKPTCGQCVKATRECVPCPGVVFRHQHNSSMNGAAAGGSGTLGRFYGYKETFDKESQWVEIPRQLTFVHITDPFKDDVPDQLVDSQSDLAEKGQHPESSWQSPDAYLAYDEQRVTHGLEALSAAASGERYSYQPSSAFENSYRPHSRQYSTDTSFHPAQSTSPQNLNFILNQPSSETLASHIDPRLHAESPLEQQIDPSLSAAAVQQLANSALAENEDDLPLLLRFFSEGPGHWMDLFDLGRLFEMDVPVKASKSPLLLYSAVALSAKALGRLSQQQREAKKYIPGYSSFQWLHIARRYYNRAISLLRQALEIETRPHSSHSQQSFSDVASPTLLKDAPYHTPRQVSQVDSDELVGTTTILCVYEFLDASGAEWSRHLDGAKSLFDIAKDGIVAMTLGSPDPDQILSARQSLSSIGRRAVFWNIVRQDMLNAFINFTSTRLDTSDLNMWRSAGLHISEAGFIVPSNEPLRHEPMQDDMVSNALVWLILKLVNYIAAGDDLPEEVSPLGLGIRQKKLLEYWDGLDRQLTAWYDGIPDGFKPSATVWPDSNHLQDDAREVKIPKKWFARPMCASTMQWYNFARVQLLHNKPHLSTGQSYKTFGLHSPTPKSPGSLAERHLSYASILQESKYHAQEIISIGLAQTDEGARVHSVQPLYAAGQLLGIPAMSEDDGASELQALRLCVLNLLRDIQSDTGWATEYRVKQLLERWRLPMDWGK